MDLFHYWNEDLSVSPTGDLQLVDTTLEGEQRVLRRLMTNAADPSVLYSLADYIWHPAYGAGLPKKIGDPIDVDAIRSVIRAQIFLEAAVAVSPDPVINVTEIQSGIFVEIKYNDAVTHLPVTISFDINN